LSAQRHRLNLFFGELKGHLVGGVGSLKVGKGKVGLFSFGLSYRLLSYLILYHKIIRRSWGGGMRWSRRLLTGCRGRRVDG
jgi:hypothetical protein